MGVDKVAGRAVLRIVDLFTREDLVLFFGLRNDDVDDDNDSAAAH